MRRKRGKVKDDKTGFLIIWRAYRPHAPMPETEYRFHTKRRWRFDYAWPEKRVAVEIDGGFYMTGYNPKTGGYTPIGGHTKDTDREKQNMAVEMGWRVLHYSPQMLRADPVGVCDQIMRVLGK